MLDALELFLRQYDPYYAKDISFRDAASLQDDRSHSPKALPPGPDSKKISQRPTERPNVEQRSQRRLLVNRGKDGLHRDQF